MVVVQQHPVIQRAGDKAFQLFCYFDTQTKVITNGYEKLFLRIEIDRASIYGIFAKNLRAISPADSDEIELLDSRGCPTDPVIFPGLEKVPGLETSLLCWRSWNSLLEI